VPSPDVIHFDVLLRGSRVGGGASSARTISELRPRAEDLARCRAWLTERDVRCETTSFGLACTATAETFAALFGSTADPRPPAELRRLVAQVTLSGSPSSF
jgi:hypothetical protein